MQMNSAIVNAAAAELLRRDLAERFDAYVPGSRPNEFQKSVLADFWQVKTQAVTAGNQSGKSTTGAKAAYWFLTETAPNWNRPASWGTGPLTGLIIGRTMRIVEHELLLKLVGFFKGEGIDYKIHKSGGVPQYITYLPTGNKLLLASHHADNEAREKVQSFVLHFVWLDEMPKSYLLFEELSRRLQSKDGYFFITFTPKVKNAQIRKLVDSYVAPYAKRYKMPMFANPILTEERKAAILLELANYPEDLRRCILDGEWLEGEQSVYYLNHEKICVNLPKTYSKGWSHVEGADPAMSSKHGTVVWAQDPETGFWYAVRAQKFEGLAAPSDLVHAVTASLMDLNIVRRVADAASDWYIKEARKMGFPYSTPHDKNNRKAEMMKNLQERLGKDLFVTEDAMDFLNELQDMQWSEGEREKIVNDRKYHLHYAGLYAVDKLPKLVIPAKPYDWNQMVHDKFSGKTKESAKPVSRAKQRILSYAMGRWNGGRK